MPPNSLKSIALPSMTGMAASGPMAPRPRTAVPSLTNGTELPLVVSCQALRGWAAMASHPGDKLLLVGGVAGPHGDVARHPFGIGGYDVHRANVAAVLPDGAHDARQR